jgi:hypothetical protein
MKKLTKQIIFYDIKITKNALTLYENYDIFGMINIPIIPGKVNGY